MPASPQDIAAYQERIRLALQELGIPPAHATERRQSIHLESDDLVSIGLDHAGREQHLERHTAAQWQAMHDAAAREGVSLLVISAFRSFDYQKQIIARKLAAGQVLDQILRVSALPGFSEHHTGRAIDIGTPGCAPLTEAFEQAPAYTWLTQHAAEFGFHLSYPRGNPHGVVFEPWHWVWNES
jgi:zinc D-Ala-D-Ala carboxypeptidase